MINVLQMLERCATEYPDNLALQDEKVSITYKEYEEYAKRVGTYLIDVAKLVPNSPVAVLIDRNVKTILAFAGIVYSGCFYVPIDTSMPKERIDLIFNTLNPVAVLDAREETVGDFDAVNVDDLMHKDCVDANAILRIRDNAIDTDPLYAIYTSGSTGVPKGVLISHRSVIDLVNAFDDAFSFEQGTVFGNQAPFDFDVSTKDIYNSLYCSGCVSVIPKRCFVAPKLLGEYLVDKKIDTIIWAVSALRIIGDYKVFDSLEELPKLKNVMFSGEVMPLKTLQYWQDKEPKARYVNLYGPTEITCNCTYHVVETGREYEGKLPIGKAFKNTRVFLKNEKGDMVTKANETGEICVEGTCLALGYWNNEEKTSAAFMPIPFTKEYKRPMYATGDMGYFSETGELYFASRRDHQIKHMGHRIELGEIESALNSIDFLTISVCVYDEENEKIVCFYEAKEECKKAIVQELAKKLPKFMWPNVYKHFDKLPMTKNGKIDRVGLKKGLEN